MSVTKPHPSPKIPFLIFQLGSPVTEWGAPGAYTKVPVMSYPTEIIILQSEGISQNTLAMAKVRPDGK